MTYLFLLLLIAAWGYQFLALVCLGRFFGPLRLPRRRGNGPGITVFKPVKGLSAPHPGMPDELSDPGLPPLPGAFRGAGPG